MIKQQSWNDDNDDDDNDHNDDDDDDGDVGARLWLLCSHVYWAGTTSSRREVAASSAKEPTGLFCAAVKRNTASSTILSVGPS